MIGYSSLRLSRHAFAIVSLSFALLCMLVARDWVSLTRGAMGIPGLPTPTVSLPGVVAWRLATPADFYYLLLGFAVIAHAVVYLVVSSRLGRAMRAVKLNEALAQSQGVDPLAYKLLTIGLSALLAGMVGGLFVFYLTIVHPSIFDFYYTETMLIMLIMSGPGSFWGVLLSAAVLSAVPTCCASPPISAWCLRRGADRRHARRPAAWAAVCERRRLARWRHRRAASS